MGYYVHFFSGNPTHHLRKDYLGGGSMSNFSVLEITYSSDWGVVCPPPPDPDPNPDPPPPPDPDPDPSPSPSPSSPGPSPSPSPSDPDPDPSPPGGGGGSGDPPDPSPSLDPDPTPTPTPPDPEPSPPSFPEIDINFPEDTCEDCPEDTFTDENFLEYAWEQFENKFPFDIFGDINTVTKVCPNVTLYGYSKDLCQIPDSLAKLKAPIWIIWGLKLMVHS